ncbi:MAG: hypothetical protein AAB625_00205 [Patescibacteria group bacterium]
MTEKVVVLTPLTIGQYKTGDEYNNGRVVKVEQTEMVVDFPEKPAVEQKTTETPQASLINPN